MYKYTWFVVWNMFYFPYYMGCHPSHWRTHIVQRGRSTTNQIHKIDMVLPMINCNRIPSQKATGDVPGSEKTLSLFGIDFTRVCGNHIYIYVCFVSLFFELLNSYWGYSNIRNIYIVTHWWFIVDSIYRYWGLDINQQT